MKKLQHIIIYWLESDDKKIVLEPRIKIVKSTNEGFEIQNTLTYLGFKCQLHTEEIKED